MNMNNPRIRFNWGYHDGALAYDLRQGYRYTHFDRQYLAGWQAGYEGRKQGAYTTDSTQAWGRLKRA